MLRLTIALASVAGTVVLGGCASERIMKPAGVTAGYMAAFQSDLTHFQSDMIDYQQRQQTLMSSRTVNTLSALSQSARIQNELTLLSCDDPVSVLTALKSQGQLETSSALATQAAPASLPSPSLPVDKLASVTTALRKLSKSPDPKENLDFLVGYGKDVNQKLQSLEKPAAKGTP